MMLFTPNGRVIFNNFSTISGTIEMIMVTITAYDRAVSPISIAQEYQAKKNNFKNQENEQIHPV